jgi:hypothetical protein
MNDTHAHPRMPRDVHEDIVRAIQKLIDQSIAEVKEERDRANRLASRCARAETALDELGVETTREHDVDLAKTVWSFVAQNQAKRTERT